MTDVQEGHKKGTTTCGIVCKDSVVLAADKRATLGFLIANKDVDKIFEVTSNIGITFAGSAADGQALAKLMKAEMKLYHLNTGVDPSLTVAASLTANVVLERAKSFIPYYVQLIMGGKDNGEYSLYSLDMGGSIIKETKFTATGSGSPMAFGVLEDNFKENMITEKRIQNKLQLNLDDVTKRYDDRIRRYLKQTTERCLYIEHVLRRGKYSYLYKK